MMLWRLLLPLWVWILAGVGALAQDQATLVADSVRLSGSNLLTAEGAVEVFYKGARLQARRITYDNTTDRLTIEGPITLNDGNGTVVLADAAELSRDLTDGVLSSARLVMQDKLQFASTEMRRREGRYTELSRVVASSCQVCPSNPVPLWEIRARRVVHDQQERQIYFDDAQFRVAGVPIFYLPKLRIPDPTLDRATGVLMPSFRTTTGLGPGLKLPYFITLGDSRDLTLTPYLTSKGGKSLEARYRQAFRTGTIEFTGAAGRDHIGATGNRGYLFGEGSFLLPRDFKLAFSVQAVSDRAYLLDYGVSDTDRLASGVSVTRTRRNEYLSGQVFKYHSIRAGDDNSVLPSLVGDFTFQRRFTPSIIGGEGQFRFQTHSQVRTSSVAFDANGDGVTDGRDVSRASLGADWRRNWVLGNGMVVAGGLKLDADIYSISQDSSFPGSVARFTPAAMVELRWPWLRSPTTAGVASQVLEPVVQFVWSPDSNDAVPNEDSQTVAIDEGNLFSFSRFPGSDQRELGKRINVGLSWTRYDASGWTTGITAGRVLRERDLGQFSAGSGLSGTASDWLVAAQVKGPDGFDITNRALFDDTLSFSRNELEIAYAADRYDLSASYLWLVADPAEGRTTATSELVFDAGWDMGGNWRGTASGRYDFEAESAARAGVGLEYRNECATVDLSLSRRFTSSTNVTPSTDFNLSVVLAGFGGGPDGRRYRAACGR